MRAIKFSYAATSLVLAFLPPYLARLLVGAIVTITAAITVWSVQEEKVVLGRVDRAVYSENVGGTFVEVSRLFADPEAVLLLDFIDPHIEPRTWDILFAFGNSRTVGTDSTRARTLFEAEHFGVLPVSSFIERIRDPAVALELMHTSNWGFALIAGLIVVFSRLALRAGFGAIFGCVTAFATFLLVHLNANAALLPIPGKFFEPLILAAGFAGLTIGFKATIGDTARLGERLTALLLAIALVPYIASVEIIPVTLAWTLPILALLSPVILPVTAAALILKFGIPLDIQSTWLAFAVLLVVGLLFQARWHGNRIHAPVKADLGLKPERSGLIDIDQLL